MKISAAESVRGRWHQGELPARYGHRNACPVLSLYARHRSLPNFTLPSMQGTDPFQAWLSLHPFNKNTPRTHATNRLTVGCVCIQRSIGMASPLRVHATEVYMYVCGEEPSVQMQHSRPKTGKKGCLDLIKARQVCAGQQGYEGWSLCAPLRARTTRHPCRTFPSAAVQSA